LGAAKRRNKKPLQLSSKRNKEKRKKKESMIMKSMRNDCKMRKRQRSPERWPT